MGLVQEISSGAGIEPLERGALLLIKRQDVDAFLSECERRRVAITGIEGFELVGERVRPDMDAIADFSDVHDSVSTVLESRRFMAEMAGRRELLFDFALLQA